MIKVKQTERKNKLIQELEKKLLDEQDLKEKAEVY